MHPLGFIGEAEGIETGVYPRQWDFDAGDVMTGHAHGMPHATLVASGRFLFTDERTGATREVGPLTWIAVAAKDLHGFQCVEPGTIFCIFAGPGADLA
jgi:quercetin dioxygenase-like cupin family protein